MTMNQGIRPLSLNEKSLIAQALRNEASRYQLEGLNANILELLNEVAVHPDAQKRVGLLERQVDKALQKQHNLELLAHLVETDYLLIGLKGIILPQM